MLSNKIFTVLIIFTIALNACKNDNEQDLKPKNTFTTTPGENTTTDGNNTGSIPDVVQLSVHIQPIFTTYKCTNSNCHGGNAGEGGVNLGTYNAINIVVKNGSLYGAISHASGYRPMPLGSQKLNNTELAIIKKWIDNGALNN